MTKPQTRYMPFSQPMRDATRRGLREEQQKLCLAARAVGDAPVWERIAACRLCAPRFAATVTRHAPRPVVWFRSGARLLIASQAPGMRAHESGIPFQDASGERLREWMGIAPEDFYDKAKVAIVPMGFCFPGYDAAGSDIPPPAICAQTWRREALSVLPDLRLTLLVGGPAQAWHLGKGGVTERVRNWRDHGPGVFALPHPSWRNTGWLRKNPWFGEEVLPALRARVQDVLHG